MRTPIPRGVLRLEADRPLRIVVLRALQLGDLLCAVPALRALRGAAPRAHITLVGLPWSRDFVSRFAAYLDEFIEFPGYPGLPERAVDVRAVPGFLASIQARSFDLAIQMHGDGRITNAVAALFGARRLAGFVPPGANGVAGEWLPYPGWLPEVRRHLALVEWLGAVGEGDGLEFPVRDAEDAEWIALRRGVGLDGGEYVCLHPGARDPARRWSVEGFAEVARLLLVRGLRVAVTGEGAVEAARAQAIAAACDGRIVDLTGRTSLGVLAAAVRDARLVVCNDTGVSHLAAAVRTPSVVVFRATDPSRWAPLDRGRHRVVRDGACALRAVASEMTQLLAGEGVRAV